MFTTQKKVDQTYQVTLVNPETGAKTTLKVRGDEYILDAAEEQNVPIPCACRAGACVVCAGKVVQGSVEQLDHSFLRDKEIKAGFLLTCRTRPTSDCVIVTHQEEELFGY